jgi:adenylyltransferase/sulfurtransferase
MQEINVHELKSLKDQSADFQLIDVREEREFEICNLQGELIPMGEIPYHIDKISKDKQVVVHCRSGKRSADVIAYLQQRHGYQNLYNLAGGVLAWSDEIDPTMPKY